MARYIGRFLLTFELNSFQIAFGIGYSYIMLRITTCAKERGGKGLGGGRGKGNEKHDPEGANPQRVSTEFFLVSMILISVEMSIDQMFSTENEKSI